MSYVVVKELFGAVYVKQSSLDWNLDERILKPLPEDHTDQAW